MRLARGNLISDAYARQVGLDQFGAQRRVEMQDRGLGRPARPQAAAPAQFQRAHRTGLGPLVHQFGPGRTMARLQRLGEDQPERGAASGRGPGLARGRQDLLDSSP